MQTEIGSRSMKAGDVLFIDMSRPVMHSGPLDAISIIFPRTMMQSMVKHVDDMHGLVSSLDTPLGRIADAHINVLSQEIGQMDATEARAIAEVTANLLVACSSVRATAPGRAGSRKRPVLLLSVKQFIEENMKQESLSAKTISQHFLISRATLFRMFKPFDGVETYIRRRRLARAYHIIAKSRVQSDDYIYQIAEDLGFSTPAAFSRSFQAEFGQKPRDVARGAVEDQLPVPKTDSLTSLSACLRELIFQGA